MEIKNLIIRISRFIIYCLQFREITSLIFSKVLAQRNFIENISQDLSFL